MKCKKKKIAHVKPRARTIFFFFFGVKRRTAFGIIFKLRCELSVRFPFRMNCTNYNRFDIDQIKRRQDSWEWSCIVLMHKLEIEIKLSWTWINWIERPFAQFHNAEGKKKLKKLVQHFSKMIFSTSCSNSQQQTTKRIWRGCLSHIQFSITFSCFSFE